MATTQSSFARAYRAADEAAELNQYFAPQRTSTADLPDPETFLRNISRGVLEIFAGVREVDQLARWLTEDAYRKLVTRANLAARARSARGIPAKRPVHQIVSVRHSSPADGFVEVRNELGEDIRWAVRLPPHSQALLAPGVRSRAPARNR